MKSIHLRLADELHAKIKEQAESDHRSLNSEIVWLLEQTLTQEEDQK